MIKLLSIAEFAYNNAKTPVRKTCFLNSIVGTTYTFSINKTLTSAPSLK